MIDESQKNDPEVAKTVRALYIISPDKRLRLSMIYPMSTGRNVEWVYFCGRCVIRLFKSVSFLIVMCSIIVSGVCSEILRVIDSLQLTDRLPHVATPANWVVSNLQ